MKYPLSYYREVLGVTADSKPDEIKKAFYKQSKRYHPDLHPDDKVKQQRYLTITEAYSILTDEYKTSSKDIKSNQQVQKGAKFAKGSVGTHQGDIQYRFITLVSLRFRCRKADPIHTG